MGKTRATACSPCGDWRGGGAPGGGGGAGVSADAAGDAGAAVGLDVEQRLAEQPQVAQDEIGPHQGLLAGAGVLAVEPLGLDAEVGPAVCHGEDPAVELAEDLPPLAYGDGGPGALALLERRARGAHPRPGGGAGGAGDDLGLEGGGGGH